MYALLAMLFFVSASEAAAIAQPEAPATYLLDSQQSHIKIFVHRAGLLRAFGHDHVISTSEIEGRLMILPEAETKVVFSLRLPVSGLLVDDPLQREQSAARFSKDIAEKDRQATRQNMLGAKLLHGDAYPEIGVSGKLENITMGSTSIDCRVSLRGISTNIVLPANITQQADGYRAQGKFDIRQSALGLTPFSVLGGTVKVADKLVIHYQLHFTTEPIQKY